MVIEDSSSFQVLGKACADNRVCEKYVYHAFSDNAAVRVNGKNII